MLRFQLNECEKQMEISIPSKQIADFLTPSLSSTLFLPSFFLLLKSIKRAINKVATLSRFYHSACFFRFLLFSFSFWPFHIRRQLCCRAISLKKIFNFLLASFSIKMFVLSTLVNLFAAIAQQKKKKIQIFIFHFYHSIPHSGWHYLSLILSFGYCVFSFFLFFFFFLVCIGIAEHGKNAHCVTAIGW